MKLTMRMCPYCEATSDLCFQISSKRYMQCSQCNLIYRDTLASYHELIQTYQEDYFDELAFDQIDGTRNKIFEHILDLIEKRRDTGTLMDVGTGCGFFLVAARKRRWETMGVDPSLQSVEIARKEFGLDVFAGTLTDYNKNRQFDVITFINVLDHSSLPWLEIDRAIKLLRPGGLIYLRFPNGYLHSLVYRMAQKWGLDGILRRFLVFHICSFTPLYVKRLLQDHGFVKTIVLNSPPSQHDPHKLFPNATLATYAKRLIYLTAKCTEKMTRGRLFVGASLEVTAMKPDNLHAG